MSRIHEALRKAEQERVVVAAPEWNAAVETTTVPEQEAAVEQTEAVVASSLAQEAPARVVEKQGRSVTWNLDPNVNVFHPASVNQQGAEQFRTLRSRLYQFRNMKPLKTILVTSSIAGEGKTFVSSNLAQAIARQSERRVLLIDADLRCSRVHVPLGAPNSPGLSDYLQGTASEEEILQFGGNGNMGFIPGGAEIKDPTEFLANSRFKGLIERMSKSFDWVLLDSPPCVPVSDASILADLCDGILIVVKAGSTPFPVVQKTRNELSRHNVLGVVLNSVEDASEYSSYYGSYGGNGNGSGSSRKG